MRRILCMLLVLLLCGSALAAEKPSWYGRYKELVPLKCEPVRYLGERFDNGYHDLLDAQGNILVENYIGSLTDFYEGVATVYMPASGMNPTAFMNEAGDLITDFKFNNDGWSWTRTFSEGLCSVSFTDQGYGCINTEGETVIEPIYARVGDFSDGLAYFREMDGGLYGYINAQGEIVIPPQFESAGEFSDGRAPVRREGSLWGYIDASGEMVIPEQFLEAGIFSEGLACVETKDEKRGYIRPDGSYAIDPVYISAGDFSIGVAPVATGTGIMEEDWCGPPVEGEIWGLVNHEGAVVLPLKYDFIEIQRSRNLTDAETTIYAELNGEPHYFRIENGMPIEITGMKAEFEISRELEAAYRERVRAEASIPFDANYPLPDYRVLSILKGLGAGILDASGYAQIPDTSYADAPYHGEFSASPNGAYDYFMYDSDMGVMFGMAPAAEDHYMAMGKGFLLKTTPFAKDALVFIAAEDFPLDSLRAEDIRAIYSGEITHWSQLGAAEAGPVTAYQGDGWAQLEFEAMMQDYWIMEPPSEYLEGDYGDYISPVHFRSLPGAIGFCMASLLDVSLNGEVKILAVDGVYPTQETIADGSYPFTTELYAVTRSNDHNPNTQILIDWVLSEQGQELVEKSGYVGYVEGQ